MRAKPPSGRSTATGRGAAWELIRGEGPLLATAIHHGHEVRSEVASTLAVSSLARLREEDPYTGAWTAAAPTRLVVHRSRFEVDLNRPREKAVYLRPEDAWGLEIWKNEPPPSLLERSLAEYDAFYGEIDELLGHLARECGSFVVLDLHSYNHRRLGPNGPASSAEWNPEVNIGTGTMNRAKWAPVVDAFIEGMRSQNFRGRQLDVRENIRFQGGFFPRWIHETYPESGCALAIEFKKFFMDEWSGAIHEEEFRAITAALKAVVPSILEGLKRVE